MNYQIITEKSKLIEFLDEIKQDELIALDTEFMREQTFFAELCLIQIATKTAAAIIDPLSPTLKDLTEFWEFLENPKKLIILHAGPQDLEIIYHIRKKLPLPIVDSQIWAMVLGYGDNISYQNLVNAVLHKTLDKSMRFADWSKRPLTKKALDYAISDVTYLLKMYPILQRQLEKTNRQDWANEELQSLLTLENYALSPETAWQRFRKLPKEQKKILALKNLAQWRDEEAIKRNLPRGFVIRDDTLLDIANRLPLNLDELNLIRGAQKFIKHQKTVDGILNNIQQAVNLSKSAIKNGVAVTKLEKTLPVRIPENALEMLKLLLKIRARQTSVVPRIIAKEEDLINFLLQKQPIKILEGWRHEVYGQYAEQLIAGKLSLKIKNNDIEFITS